MDQPLTPRDQEYLDLQIKPVMQRCGVNGIELARRLGKKSQYIYNIINGTRPATINSLLEIARALDVPFRDLFGPGHTSSGQPVAEGQQLKATCPHCGHDLTLELH